jgi:hypothetical protein
MPKLDGIGGWLEDPSYSLYGMPVEAGIGM